FQGDGLVGLPLVNLREASLKQGRAFLVSNTCDVDLSNSRMFAVSLTYAPILSLSRYLNALRQQYPQERSAQLEQEIRQQAIPQIFFLAKKGKLNEDWFVRLDRMMSCASTTVEREKVPDIRLFTLSDFGAWLLALKLSIHFCRIRDQVDR